MLFSLQFTTEYVFASIFFFLKLVCTRTILVDFLNAHFANKIKFYRCVLPLFCEHTIPKMYTSLVWVENTVICCEGAHSGCRVPGGKPGGTSRSLVFPVFRHSSRERLVLPWHIVCRQLHSLFTITEWQFCKRTNNFTFSVGSVWTNTPEGEPKPTRLPPPYFLQQLKIPFKTHKFVWMLVSSSQFRCLLGFFRRNDTWPHNEPKYRYISFAGGGVKQVNSWTEDTWKPVSGWHSDDKLLGNRSRAS